MPVIVDSDVQGAIDRGTLCLDARRPSWTKNRNAAMAVPIRAALIAGNSTTAAHTAGTDPISRTKSCKLLSVSGERAPRIGAAPLTVPVTSGATSAPVCNTSMVAPSPWSGKSNDSTLAVLSRIAALTTNPIAGRDALSTLLVSTSPLNLTLIGSNPPAMSLPSMVARPAFQKATNDRVTRGTSRPLNRISMGQSGCSVTTELPQHEYRGRFRRSSAYPMTTVITTVIVDPIPIPTQSTPMISTQAG